jgi:hypothetical protein
MTSPLIPPRFTPRVAQPLDNLVENARDVIAGLFDAPDPKDLPAAAREQIEHRKRICAIAARKFADADGIALLEALCDDTIRRPLVLVTPNMQRDTALLYAAQREGQNQTLYILLNMIAEGRGEQTTQREGA